MKKIFILGLILLFFFSSTCVFANDINETSLTSDNEISVVQNANNEVILNLSENDLLETGDGTFTELQNKINNASEGSTITLENNYVLLLMVVVFLLVGILRVMFLIVVL